MSAVSPTRLKLSILLYRHAGEACAHESGCSRRAWLNFSAKRLQSLGKTEGVYLEECRCFSNLPYRKREVTGLLFYQSVNRLLPLIFQWRHARQACHRFFTVAEILCGVTLHLQRQRPSLTCSRHCCPSNVIWPSAVSSMSVKTLNPKP